MTEHRDEKVDSSNNNESSGDDKSAHNCKRRHCGEKRGKCGKFLFGTLAVVGVVWIAAAAFGPQCGYAGWNHGGHHWSESDSSKHLDRMTDRLIDRADASREQGEQIKSIVRSYAPRFQSMKSAHQENHKVFTQLLTQSEINRGELETIRQSVFAELNQNSQELVQMIADIADVLTPEQRQQMANEMRNGFRHSH